MRKPKLGRPSPALIVAIAALVVALGGTAVAASRINGNLLEPQSVGGGKLRQFTGGLLKKDSVGGTKLKRQSVGGGKLRQFTAGLLKKQSLGAGKVKKDTLGGYQIDEDRLGPVPAAKSVVGNSRYMVKLAFGQSAALATVGPFTLTGECVHDSTDLKGETGRDIARVLISTTEAGSAFSGSATPGGGPLRPDTPAAQRIAIEYSAPSGAAAYLSGGSVTAYSPSGAGLLEPAGANAAALNMFGAPCTFQGLAMRS